MARPAASASVPADKAGLSMTRYFHLLKEERNGPSKPEHKFEARPREYWSLKAPVISFGDYGRGQQSFRMLRQVAFDELSRLWIVDSCNNRVQVRDSATGNYLETFQGDESAAGGGLLTPSGIAVARLGSQGVFVCDQRHGPRVCEYDRGTGALRRQLVPTCAVNTLSACALSPCEKLLAVTDSQMHRVHIFTLNGPRPPLVFGEQGFRDGQFMFPSDVCFSADGQFILVADRENHRIQIFELDGTFVRQIKLASHADCVVCQTEGHILTVDDSGLSMFSMAGDVMFSKIGGLNLRYSNLSGLAVDLNDGKIAVADELNSQVHVV